ncbi:flagellar M-ring protein FliF C-terminal domain-containing protein, partial [Escherichia coli]|uniref:flagellar M-ring protein FliF C-terminal domain-containing protein n=1 Tax=Escherichia coli TaxID=562 RepID=UPI0028DFFF7B
NQADQNGQVSAANNIPGGAAGSPPGSTSSDSGKTEETTNYETSKKTTTTIAEPGAVKRLTVAVAVDGVTAAGKGGKPGPYTPRT